MGQVIVEPKKGLYGCEGRADFGGNSEKSDAWIEDGRLKEECQTIKPVAWSIFLRNVEDTEMPWKE